MLGKDTVLFIDAKKENYYSPIIDEINRDAGFLAVRLPFERLSLKIKIWAKRPVVALVTKVWIPIVKFFAKFIKKITVPKEPYYYDVTGRKKAYNMIYRYTPSAIVTSEPEIRYSIERAIRRSGMNVKIFVFSDQIGFDYDLLSDSVAHYFVDNIAIRDAMRDKGVPATKIDVNPLPVDESFYAPIDSGMAKQNVGIEPTKKTCFIALQNGMVFDFNPESCPSIDFIMKQSDIAIMGEKAIGYRAVEDNANMADVFNACDYVVTRFDSYTIKRASALKKPVILIIDKDKASESEKYLTADDRVAAIVDGGELIKAFDMIDKGEIVLKGDDVEETSAEKVAFEIKEQIKSAK